MLLNIAYSQFTQKKLSSIVKTSFELILLVQFPTSIFSSSGSRISVSRISQAVYKIRIKLKSKGQTFLRYGSPSLQCFSTIRSCLLQLFTCPAKRPATPKLYTLPSLIPPPHYSGATIRFAAVHMSIAFILKKLHVYTGIVIYCFLLH